jgi:phage shock protein A
MALKLVNRITQLVKADAHGVVDALEDKSLLLKQHVREAELDLLQKRARVKALGEEAERLDQEVARGREDLAQLEDDIAIALEEKQEDLARFSIRKLIPARKELAGLERVRADVGEERAKLAELVALQEAQLLELKQRVGARLAEFAKEPGDVDVFFGPTVSDEEVELELLRRRRPAGGTQ